METKSGKPDVNWKLNNVSMITTIQKVPFDKYEKYYSAVVLKLDVERMSHGFIHQTVIPAVIISLSNVLYLTIDPSSYERIVLLILNVGANSIYIEQLRWMIPDDDDSPTFLMFFLSSQFITVILIFLTIFTNFNSSEKLENWQTKLLTDIEEYRVGKFYISNIFETGDLKIMQKWSNFIRRSSVLIFAIIYGVMFYKMFTKFVTTDDK